MVNICGKCKHYLKSEIGREGNFFHYCGKVNEDQPPLSEGEIGSVPTLHVHFNDMFCEYYEKKRR